MSAKGKRAYGFCDRTGFRYKLGDLVPEYTNGRPNGWLVGRDMEDIDHEQLRLDEINVSEDISLDNPRPDRTLTETRALYAWDPVGGGRTHMGSRTVGLDMSAVVGRVTVT